MLSCLYNISIYLYSKIIALVSLFNTKARLLYRGESKTFDYLLANIKPEDKIIWVHTASLGEFEQGRPLIEQIKEQHPEYKILLSFFSPSGYEVRKNYDKADYICYLPFDTKRKARKFISITKPHMAFFVKYEYWKNYFYTCSEQSVPIYIVSGIFREKQLFFKHNFIGSWYRKILDQVCYFFIQNEKSAKLLEGTGKQNFDIVGDTRFDRVAEIATQAEELPIIKEFKGNSPLLVVGSSWAPDEKALLPFIKQNKCKVVIAPHEVHQERINSLLKLGQKSLRYTQCKHQDKELAEANILIIDCIGILSKIYQYADVAYIGGGFGVGIHNTLEASVYNIPIMFGPNYKKFHEACEMVERKIAYPIANEKEILDQLPELISNKSLRSEIRENCQLFMSENFGATEKILTKVFNNSDI